MLNLIRLTKKRLILFSLFIFFVTLFQLSVGELSFNDLNNISYLLLTLSFFVFSYLALCFFVSDEINVEQKNKEEEKNNPSISNTRMSIMMAFFFCTFAEGALLFFIDNNESEWDIDGELFYPWITASFVVLYAVAYYSIMRIFLKRYSLLTENTLPIQRNLFGFFLFGLVFFTFFSLIFYQFVLSPLL